MGEDALLTGATQRAIAGVALSPIVFSGDGSHLLEFFGRRRIAVRRWRADPQHRFFPKR